jgi:alpha-tubulin suppressor-like RCC1 family protein
MSLHVWGSNANRQLGISSPFKTNPEPQLVRSLEGKTIVSCAVGEFHTLATTEWGDVYAWGRGKEGQLGAGRRTLQESTPQKIQTLAGETITEVCAGAFHSLAISAPGRLYQWGLVHRSEDTNVGAKVENFSEQKREEDEDDSVIEAQAHGEGGDQDVIEANADGRLEGLADVVDDADHNDRIRRVVRASNAEYLTCGR